MARAPQTIEQFFADIEAAQLQKALVEGMGVVAAQREGGHTVLIVMARVVVPEELSSWTRLRDDALATIRDLTA